jgi:hypothetical protein
MIFAGGIDSMGHYAEALEWIALALLVGMFVGVVFYAAATLWDAIDREIDILFGVGGPWEGERRGEQDAADGSISDHDGLIAPETMPAASGKAADVTGAARHA